MSDQNVVIAPLWLMDSCCTDDLVHHLVDTAKDEYSRTSGTLMINRHAPNI